MTSPDIVLGYHKLDTKFLDGHVQHTTFHSEASQGRRRVKVVKTWYRGRELGRGSFGTVFLERSGSREHRAVKEIAKEKSRIDYKRELMAMAILAKHDALFVQFFGWYESSDYVYIAMEYISHGNLRSYLEVERSENEAKVITRQLLEGLAIIHQEGFAHRDLKPENIFVVSASPISVKIGDFGLAKLAKDGTAFRTQAFSRGYSAPDMGVATSDGSSEYTNAVDIWALGCIMHEMLTRVLPFPSFFELRLYCTRPEFPRNTMLLKNISREGIEFVARMLALPPDRRIAAKDALNSEWLRLESEGAKGRETERSTGLVLPEERAFPMPMRTNSSSTAPYNSNMGGNSVGGAMASAEAFSQLDTANAHLRHPDSSASTEGGPPGTAEYLLDSGTGNDQPEPPTPYIPVGENDRYLLNHFLDNVLPIIFPILDLHVDVRRDVILPALAANECYRTCCLSAAALHLKATQGLQGKWTDQDIRRHRYATISGLYDALARDQGHLQILQATLGMILFQCSVGPLDDSLPDISWRQHFQAVANLVNKLDLTRFLQRISQENLSIPSVNMATTAWVDILGATMLGRNPQFADAYREQHLSNGISGLRELMGCDDRVMYLISEISCLEAQNNTSMLSGIDLRQRIKSLAHQIDLTESAMDHPASASAVIITASGQIDTRQLTNTTTNAFRFAARTYLCSLAPGFDRHQPQVMELLNKLTLCLESIPTGPDGLDRPLVWVYLIGGSVATPGSLFMSFFKGRCAALGDAAGCGSFGRMTRILETLWARRESGWKGSWRDVMQSNAWDFLLI